MMMVRRDVANSNWGTSIASHWPIGERAEGPCTPNPAAPWLHLHLHLHRHRLLCDTCRLMCYGQTLFPAAEAEFQPLGRMSRLSMIVHPGLVNGKDVFWPAPKSCNLLRRSSICRRVASDKTGHTLPGASGWPGPAATQPIARSRRVSALPTVRAALNVLNPSPTWRQHQVVAPVHSTSSHSVP